MDARIGCKFRMKGRHQHIALPEHNRSPAVFCQHFDRMRSLFHLRRADKYSWERPIAQNWNSQFGFKTVNLPSVSISNN